MLKVGGEKGRRGHGGGQGSGGGMGVQTAWTIIVSTFSGENLSLYRDRECERPKVIWLSCAWGKLPDKRLESWALMQRMNSATVESAMHSMSSFLWMDEASLWSKTASFSPLTADLRNFLRESDIFPSFKAVAASKASAVSSNLRNCFKDTLENSSNAKSPSLAFRTLVELAQRTNEKVPKLKLAYSFLAVSALSKWLKSFSGDLRTPSSCSLNRAKPAIHTQSLGQKSHSLFKHLPSAYSRS